MPTDTPGPGAHRREALTLAAAGDAILTRELLPYEGNDERFDGLLDLLRGSLVAVANLEVIVHDYEPAPAAHSGGTYMRAPPAVLDELAGMGFSLFSAATNHSYDYGAGGVERTLEELRRRRLAFAGLGGTLFEARRPGYVETPAGRVGLVSASTSFPPGAPAGEQTAAMRGRPGLNPLRVEAVYHLTEARLEALRGVSEAAGIEAMKRSWLDRGLYYDHDWDDPSYFHIGDMKFRAVDDEADEGIEYEVDEDDQAALLESVAEANEDADWVVASVHTHQGAGGRQNTPETPPFLVDVAHDAVDAGANAVICHGPHVLRGIEIYRDRPVFYSLGNFIVQNETVSRLPAESFRRYGLEGSTRVADVFRARLYDESGEPKGDLANEAFWETVVPRCTFGPAGGLTRLELHPCTLQRDRPRPQRGIPVLATGEQARAILTNLDDLSSAFGTKLRIEDGVGVVD